MKVCETFEFLVDQAFLSSFGVGLILLILPWFTLVIIYMHHLKVELNTSEVFFSMNTNALFFLHLWDKIQPESLLKYRGLRMVTSSIEKKEFAKKVEKIDVSSENQEAQKNKNDDAEGHEQKNIGRRISASAAYQIAASAASYLHSHTWTKLPFKSSNPEISKGSSKDGSGSDSSADAINSDMASLMATTDSLTAVVASKEEVKQAVANDLKSTHSSPCEWFICDDDQSATRFFVIQVGVRSPIL